MAGVRGYVYEGPRVPPFATGPPFFTASTFPRIAADTRSGNVYLVYGNGGRPTVPGEARAADHFIHPDIDVWFQRSTDRGGTWSRPTKLNDELRVPTEITQTRHPSVSVAPGGRVDVVWHDRRHWYRGCLHTHTPCLEARLGDTYYSFSGNAGRSFSADRRLTDRSINNDVGYDYRFGTYWFFPPVAVPLDERRLLVGWMDSRNGNVETDTQGIYLARVTHGASRRVPRAVIGAERTSALSVELSRRAYPAGPEAVLGGTFATRPWTRVVIVNQRDEAGALAGGVLARANIGTVLVSAADGLSDEVKAELARLQPIGAYVVGSERRLSAQVVEDLAATGIPSGQIERLSGSSAADTARLIAEEADRRTTDERASGAPAFDAAILVNPDSDDAYAAAVLAATRRLPILFARRGSLSAATRQALASLALRRVLVVGGERVLSARALRGLPRPTRLGGSTQLRTSLAVLRESRRRGVAENIVYAADGRMESALLGPAAARMGGLQLMAGGDRAASVLADLRLSSGVDRLVQVRGGDGE